MRTDAGDIEAEIVVNCAGQWAKQVGAMAGVNVPLHSAEHFYVVTDTIDGVHPDLPILRDPDGYTYFKEEVGGLVIGGFEPEAKPWCRPDKIPYPFEFQLLEEDWDHFEILMNSALLRIPALERNRDQEVLQRTRELHTRQPVHPRRGARARELLRRRRIQLRRHRDRPVVPGGRWPNGSSTAHPPPISRVSISGASRRSTATTAGCTTGSEVLGLHYEIPWPNRELKTARPFRRSPVHHLLVDANANFGSKMGWERANFFAPPGADPIIEYSWGKPNWLAWSAAEHTNTRTTSRFSTRRHSPSICSSAPTPKPRCSGCAPPTWRSTSVSVYTGMLNERGTYESDVTVTRTAATSSSSSAAPPPPSGTRTTSARTSRRDPSGPRGRDIVVGVFGVMGPDSRELLATLTSADLGDEAFRSARASDLTGLLHGRATRITYVGELGWELYVPAEFAVGVYEDLMAAGASSGCPRRLLRHRVAAPGEGLPRLRAGTDPDDNPVEAGLLFACKLKTDVPFLGRAAVEKAKAEGPRRRLVGFSVGSADPMLWGGELILRDGVVAGQVTSAAWGETAGRCVGLAYLRAPDYARHRRLDQ